MGPNCRIWGFFSSPLGDNVLGVGGDCYVGVFKFVVGGGAWVV